MHMTCKHRSPQSRFGQILGGPWLSAAVLPTVVPVLPLWEGNKSSLPNSRASLSRHEQRLGPFKHTGEVRELERYLHRMPGRVAVTAATGIGEAASCGDWQAVDAPSS